ncbi:WXG100 family type VII secretion target [Streptomyces sp. NBC_01476]|uniref:WXG100 family type VII secretion target n=1 Tax=Streptomyces sp. NBC_01476 TaxID=2903881 RepID=UPI002E337575|nr:WXG100 family type VII secretion target [Streptomyces sp. NBC_01476]
MVAGPSTGYQVTPEQVSTAAASCTSTAADVQQRLAALKSYVVNMEAMWQGVAANTFQQMMAEYDILSKMLHDALTDIASGLNGNYVNYTESEQANVNSITSIQNSLGERARVGPASLT